MKINKGIIQDLMLESDLSLFDLSTMTGLDTLTLNKIIVTGIAEKEEVFKISEGLHITLDTLVVGDKTFGLFAAMARHETGLSMRKFAEVADVHWNTVQNVENDKFLPNIISAYKMAKACGLTIEQYMGFDKIDMEAYFNESSKL